MDQNQRMAMENRNYSNDRDTDENRNDNDKYSVTGESEFSRESTVPYDQDEVLSERHYNLGPLSETERQNLLRSRISRRESRPEDYRGVGPKGYQRSDDRIKEDASFALYRSTEVDASEIEVFVDKGIVTLKGCVSTRDQKTAAESAVENLFGVEDVRNELSLRKKGEGQKLGKRGLMDNITGMN
jgi:metal-sulfur cluster biosynthetic enzyme